MDGICHILRSVIDYALFFDVRVPLALYGFTDIDWVASICERRSTSGCIISFGCATMTWSSKN